MRRCRRRSVTPTCVGTTDASFREHGIGYAPPSVQDRNGLLILLDAAAVDVEEAGRIADFGEQVEVLELHRSGARLSSPNPNALPGPTPFTTASRTRSASSMTNRPSNSTPATVMRIPSL